MNRSLTLIGAGIAGALVLTAAFLPGRSTVQGITATGNAANSAFKGAEGIA